MGMLVGWLLQTRKQLRIHPVCYTFWQFIMRPHFAFSPGVSFFCVKIFLWSSLRSDCLPVGLGSIRMPDAHSPVRPSRPNEGHCHQSVRKVYMCPVRFKRDANGVFLLSLKFKNIRLFQSNVLGAKPSGLGHWALDDRHTVPLRIRRRVCFI